MSLRKPQFCLQCIALILLGVQISSAKCPEGKLLVGEDDKFWYCAGRSDFPEAAAEIVFALDDAARKVNPKKSLDLAAQDKNCSAFFRAVGKRLGAQGDEWKESIKDARGKHKDMQANDIIQMIRQNSGGNWQPLHGNEPQVTRQVQQLANGGVIVVAVREGATHGHLAIASPMPPGVNLEDFCCHGPMVRDGNVHASINGKKEPGAWGTVRGGYAFGSYSSAPPDWYIWLPSKQRPPYIR